MTSKERAEWRKQAMKLESIVQIGKDGITPALVHTVLQAINNRELIKITVLENSGEDVREIADELATRTESEVIQVIGRKIVLYKYNTEKKRKEK